MPALRFTLRFIIFLIALVGYCLVSFSVFIFSGFSLVKGRPFLIKIISLGSKIGLVIFGVKVRKDFTISGYHQNYLIVSNHLSYLDILVISSFFPTCFVTSQEMKETPFLGQLCMLGGCLFVERRKRSGITNEVKELALALASGLNVVIFPEARSTNGEAVIPFRRPLFQAAINSQTDILPMCINYRTLDGEKLTLKNRDKVFWYGDKSFFAHAFSLMTHKSVVAELTAMNPIDSKNFSDKNALADASYELVRNEYQVITHSL